MLFSAPSITLCATVSIRSRATGPPDQQTASTGYFYGPGDNWGGMSGSAHIAIHDHESQNAMHWEVLADRGEARTRFAVTPDAHGGWDNSRAFDAPGILVRASVALIGCGSRNSLMVGRFKRDAQEWAVAPDCGAFTYGFNTSIATGRNGNLRVLSTATDDWYSVGDLRHACEMNGKWQIEPVATDAIRGRFPTLAFDDLD